MSLHWIVKFLPIKHYIFLDEYFYLVDQLSCGKIPIKIVVFYSIFIIKIANFIPMFQSQNTELTKLIIFDYFYVYNVTLDFGVLMFSIFQQSCYFYYVMYFVAPKNVLVSNPKIMLFNLKNTLFLEKYINRIPVEKFIQNSTLFVLNMMMGLVNSLGKKFVFFIFSMTNFCLQLDSSSTQISSCFL